MRKVEKQMISAIMQSKDWKLKHDEVVISRNQHGTPVHADVYLFKNHIARWFYGYSGRPVELAFTPVVCSVTTKGRLNALLGQLGACAGQRAPGIYQRKGVWYMDAGPGAAVCHIGHDELWRVYWSRQWDGWQTSGVSRSSGSLDAAA